MSTSMSILGGKTGQQAKHRRFQLSYEHRVRSSSQHLDHLTRTYQVIDL